MAPKRPFVLVGPTGSGKTALAIALAQRLGAVVLSADSRQVYRSMDIGTAKPTEEERILAPHLLIDLAWPDEPFTVADFQRLGQEEMTRQRQAGTPFLVAGGSPFYLYALLGSFFLPSAGANWELRQRLELEADVRGLERLHKRLAEIDPDSAGRIHPHDRRRIIRALEVWELTGKPRSHFRPVGFEGAGYRIVGLALSHDELARRLQRRMEEMFRRGLLEEVQGLLDRGYGPNLTPLQSIGYAQVIRLLQGKISQEQAQAEIVLRSLQFARRQMTWFKRDPRVEWFQVEADFDAEGLAETLLTAS
jgi:tRNA dimethylallyltransferase